MSPGITGEHSACLFKSLQSVSVWPVIQASDNPAYDDILPEFQ